MTTWLDTVKERVPPTAFIAAQAEQAAGRDAADYLMKQGHLTPAQVMTTLSLHHDLPALLLPAYHPDESILSKVPEETARDLPAAPLFVLRGRLFVAVADPGNLQIEDWLTQLTGLPVELVVTTAGSLAQALNLWYGGEVRSARKMEELSAAAHARRVDASPSSAAPSKSPPPPPAAPASPSSPATAPVSTEEAPSVKIASHILATAIRLGASDIHLEPFEEDAMLRYRVDGVLREYPAPPLDVLKAVTSRLKIISNLDVSERRLPQDGRCAYELDGRTWDLRVSVMPNLYGESVVIRVLDAGSRKPTLADLGFSPEMLTRFRHLIHHPYGMVLVTGPTGSGKSTTLYATLREILTPEKKILTLEDPVESQIRGVTQFQMNNAIGYTFARALRSTLRHDPEVILVGEIRDAETAEIAISASLTGHLLFSTLHTNDAPSAITRLIDMGVSAYMVMTSLLGVLAQRLVRRLCLHCRVPLEVTRGHLAALGLPELPAGAVPYAPVGCRQCENIGLRGRASIYELLEITPEMRRLPAEQTTAERFREMAEKEGFTSLRMSALDKWLQGVTSLEEVVKVTVEKI